MPRDKLRKRRLAPSFRELTEEPGVINDFAIAATHTHSSWTAAVKRNSAAYVAKSKLADLG